MRPLALREGEMDIEVQPAVFLQYVDKDEGVRERAVQGDKALQVSWSFLFFSCWWGRGEEGRS